MKSDVRGRMPATDGSPSRLRPVRRTNLECGGKRHPAHSAALVTALHIAFCTKQVRRGGFRKPATRVILEGVSDQGFCAAFAEKRLQHREALLFQHVADDLRAMVKALVVKYGKDRVPAALGV